MTYRLSKEDAKDVVIKIRQNVEKYFENNELSYAIFGKSEGLDSSVIAGLLSGIECIKPIGVIMPCESNPDVSRSAKMVLEHFQIPSIFIDLSEEFHFLMGRLYSTNGVYGQLAEILKQNGDADLLSTLPHRKARAAGNIKARLRMITLYHIAQLTGGVVVSTDNYSEYWMGFWTLNGDVGDVAPIQQIWKGLEEYAIAEALGVPEEALHAVPTDGLDIIPGGSDEDQLGLPYHELDKVIIALIQNRLDRNVNWSEDDISKLSQSISERLNYEPKIVQHIAHILRRTRYKRNWPWSTKRSDLGLPNIQDCKV